MTWLADEFPSDRRSFLRFVVPPVVVPLLIIAVVIILGLSRQ